METSPMIYRANQWTGFYMITASVIRVKMVMSEFSQNVKFKAHL